MRLYPDLEEVKFTSLKDLIGTKAKIQVGIQLLSEIEEDSVSLKTELASISKELETWDISTSEDKMELEAKLMSLCETYAIDQSLKRRLG